MGGSTKQTPTTLFPFYVRATHTDTCGTRMLSANLLDANMSGYKSYNLVTIYASSNERMTAAYQGVCYFQMIGLCL